MICRLALISDENVCAKRDHIDKEQTLLHNSMQIQKGAKPYAGMKNTSQPFQAH
jgi:hypothetical protein